MCAGLKRKGDGIPMPPDNYDKRYGWGECPSCDWWPIQPPAQLLSPVLKACVADNVADPSAEVRRVVSIHTP